MREISVRAGQGNHNAAAYHFGSSEGIIEALLDRRMGPIDARRAEMIAALPDEPTLDDLVPVLVVPLAEACERHPSYIGFFAQLRLSRRYAHLVTHDRPRTVSVLDVRAQIDTALPDVAAEERSRRRWLCATLIVHAIAEFVASPDDQPHRSWEELVAGVIAACVGVLGAPC